MIPEQDEKKKKRTIGYGFGSEWHLLRYLGYHRSKLNEAIKAKTGATEVDWLDSGFSGKPEPLEQDNEYKGLNFLPAPGVPAQWKQFWPQSGSGQNWDAVAQIRFADGHQEWLLVEAKAHEGELNSHSNAESLDSIAKIESAIGQTMRIVRAPDAALNVWTGKYYQYANRLAALAFLNNMLPDSSCVPPVPAHLLYICFCGDTHTGCDCPANEAAWKPTLDGMENALGIDSNADLMQRVHHLFLNVGAGA